MKKFIVVQHYRVEVEVEAVDAEQAREACIWDENAYTVTATFDRQPRSLYVEAADIDTEVYEVEEQQP